jgi:NAD(P)-dependent dehydrogenase (short-subunit alcohol dehydrogenase family)
MSDGRGVLVTGASRGIGAAVARAFAQRGDRVAVHYGSRRERAEEVRASLAGLGHVVVGAPLGDPEAVREMVEEAGAALGAIDVLVNNAGIYTPHPIDGSTYEEWQRGWQETLAVNLVGAANVTWCAVRHMARAGASSTSPRAAPSAGEPEQPAYGASKAGMIAFGQSLARALGPRGIAVTAVAPGFTETDMAAEALSGEDGERRRKESPMGRVATPEEVAAAVLFLASPRRNGDGHRRRRQRGLVPADVAPGAGGREAPATGADNRLARRHRVHRLRRMASRRILLQLGSGILVFQVLAADVAIAANWPAQFGGVGTDACAEALTCGTALSAPLFPLAVFAVGLVCSWRGATRTGAAVVAVVALAILAGSLGEAFAPATADVPKGVLIASGRDRHGPRRGGPRPGRRRVARVAIRRGQPGCGRFHGLSGARVARGRRRARAQRGAALRPAPAAQPCCGPPSCARKVAISVSARPTKAARAAATSCSSALM